MGIYTGEKYLPNDGELCALFAVHCLGAEVLEPTLGNARYKLNGEVLRIYSKATKLYNTFPLWHTSPVRIIEDYDLVDVIIKQTAGGWVFVKDAVAICTRFDEYDQAGWIPSCHHARSKRAALAHGLMLIALALQGVDVTRRE